MTASIFWALWGFAVASIDAGRRATAIQGPLVIAAMLDGVVFYLTLFRVWLGETELPAWRAMFSPRSTGLRQRAIRSLWNRKWLVATLRATHWPLRFLVVGLVSLLATDLVLYALLMTRGLRR